MNAVSVIFPYRLEGCGSSTTQLPAWCGNPLSAGPTTFWMCLPQQTLLSWLNFLCPENRVLCRLGDSEFDDGLGWNLYLLLRRRIEARTCLSLLLYELAK